MSHSPLVETINSLIDTVIKPYKGALLVDLKMSITPLGRYKLTYTIDSDFKNNSILKESCFQTTDDILTWFEFTDIIEDFDIQIRTPNKNIEMSYYELMKDCISDTRALVIHPRVNEYQKYFINKNEKDSYLR